MKGPRVEGSAAVVIPPGLLPGPAGAHTCLGALLLACTLGSRRVAPGPGPAAAPARARAGLLRSHHSMQAIHRAALPAQSPWVWPLPAGPSPETRRAPRQQGRQFWGKTRHPESQSRQNSGAGGGGGALPTPASPPPTRAAALKPPPPPPPPPPSSSSSSSSSRRAGLRRGAAPRRHGEAGPAPRARAPLPSCLDLPRRQVEAARHPSPLAGVAPLLPRPRPAGRDAPRERGLGHPLAPGGRETTKQLIDGGYIGPGAWRLRVQQYRLILKPETDRPICYYENAMMASGRGRVVMAVD
jgi:hypothetical protein